MVGPGINNSRMLAPANASQVSRLIGRFREREEASVIHGGSRAVKRDEDGGAIRFDGRFAIRPGGR
ncbi:hypothetical protein BGC_24690 [Burkholderia sp. 3C]